ncbi:hypothetical protein [Heyndrickxia vini]|uniref:N-acetyltransferase domain-containing protein n=1 Tax=Heyndrickxia vini TaxID=1476025 RepID=A0ABX7E3J7_9BACI|nr:hypothetical protein [Heyndrickxia vini]QQZ10278.1 hypothetical protein I5776_04800 [Heyndrickxia vini]
MDIRFFKLNETKQLQKGINDIWANNHIFFKEERLLKYMFHDNPSRHLITKDGCFSFLGAWENNNLIGLLGILPFALNIQGKRDFGFSLTNWIVSPEYRTTGAGLALLKKVQSLNPSIILSLGINENVANLYRVMRWNVLNDCPRWIGIINKEKTNELLLNGNSNSLRYWNEVNAVQIKSSYKVSEVIEIDEQTWNNFYWNIFAKESVGFVRDYLFLKWRYFNHPYFKYRVLICKDQNENYKGIAIVRVEEIINSEKIGRIVEFIASDQDSAISLANSIINLDKEILFFDFYCFSSISSWGLEAVGFKRVLKSENEKLVVPSRFHPIDYTVTNLMSSMFINSNVTKKMNIIKDNLWYVTKGDSDQDRPN